MLTVLKSRRKALALTLALTMLLAVPGCTGNHPAAGNPEQEALTYTQREMDALQAKMQVEIDHLTAENNNLEDELDPHTAGGEDEKIESKTDGEVHNNISVLGSNPVGNVMAIAFNKSTDFQDAAVPTDVKPAKSFVTDIGKTYCLPDDVKKNGDTYETSNSKILTVERDSGRFKTIACGTAYIVVTNGAEKRYFKITVGAGTVGATTQTTVSGALAEYPVTVTDKTTPAVTVGGFKSNDVYAMYFQSANGVILGSISEDTYRKVAQAATDTGVLDGVVDSRVWMAEQFNLYRGLSKVSANTDGNGKVDTIAIEDEILQLTNAARRDAGLEELSPSSSANDLARERAAEVATNYSHTRPDGSTVTELGYGENYTHRNSAQSAYDSWMNSPGHKANILREGITITGVGVYQAPNGNVYCVQLFAY